MNVCVRSRRFDFMQQVNVHGPTDCIQLHHVSHLLSLSESERCRSIELAVWVVICFDALV